MRIFVYEYLLGRGLERLPYSDSLRREGGAIVAALLEDFCAVPQVSVVTRLDLQWAQQRSWPRNLTILPADTATEESDLRAAARAADFTLLVAPECDDLLATRCQWVEEAGGRLLGPSSAAVRFVSDKLRLSEFLKSRGIPTPHTVTLADADALAFPLVVKPRVGAGSQATFLVRDRAELVECPRRAAAEGWVGELIAQPFIAGEPGSVTFVLGPGGKLCLRPARQRLSDDGRFRYLGGSVPLENEKIAKALAVRVPHLIPGLRGWFGIDLVLHGNGGSILEVNPRLTTSYLGLRRLARFNLMDTLLGVVARDSLPPVEWLDGPVAFDVE